MTERAPWFGSTRRRRLPPDWPTIRAHVLRRDGGVCHVCGRPGADEVDHLIEGDDHRETNLAAIHARPCHATKTARAANATRWKVRERRDPEPHPGLMP